MTKYIGFPFDKKLEFKMTKYTHDIWQYLTEDISKYSIMEYLTRNSNIYDCIMFNIFVDESLTNV